MRAEKGAHLEDLFEGEQGSPQLPATGVVQLFCRRQERKYSHVKIQEPCVTFSRVREHSDTHSGSAGLAG